MDESGGCARVTNQWGDSDAQINVRIYLFYILYHHSNKFTFVIDENVIGCFASMSSELHSLCGQRGSTCIGVSYETTTQGE
jgi:hypothetical protein